MTFIEELEDLINKHSQENESNTPDFILAEYLTNCLCAFNRGVNLRENWYDSRPNAPLNTTDITKGA